MSNKSLIVIVGPTGVGKTEYCLRYAEQYSCPILNADSRQIYREIPIGTAAPTAAEQARVKHYFVGTKSITEDYNAGMYEREALTLLEELFKTQDTVLMAGGAMMYIDAVCNGLDNIPDIPLTLRRKVQSDYKDNGLEWLQEEVKRVDTAYFSTMSDPKNPQRLMHALEVSLFSGKPYSTFRIGQKKKRPFNIRKIGLNRPRPELYDRINRRVDQMLADGLLEEARSVYPLKHLNSLQTVGYKELFDYFDGLTSFEEAVRLIKQNSRHYAKRQLTWFRHDSEIEWINL